MIDFVGLTLNSSKFVIFYSLLTYTPTKHMQGRKGAKVYKDIEGRNAMKKRCNGNEWKRENSEEEDEGWHA